jgi:branched-chain amino acid transport system substrate-binding protein
MHENSNVNLILGPLSSAELNAVAPYVNENEILLISPSSTAMALAQNDNIFRNTLDDDKQAKALSAFVAHEGYENVDVIYRNDSYGNGFYENFKEYFTQLGNTCGQGVSYEPNTASFDSVLTELESQVNTSLAQYGPQKTAVLLIGFDEAAAILESLGQTNTVLTNLRWFTTDGVTHNKAVSHTPGIAAIAEQINLTGSILGTHTGEDTLFYTESFLFNFGSALQYEPSGYDVAAYDAAWVMTHYMIYVDWDTTLPFAEARQSFLEITNKSVGYLNVNFLNENGDRMFGNFDFFTIKPQAQTKWDRVATYTFFIDEEGLTDLRDEDPSSTHQWSILK